jgi:hypothetical protein
MGCERFRGLIGPHSLRRLDSISLFELGMQTLTATTANSATPTGRNANGRGAIWSVLREEPALQEKQCPR